MKYLNDGRFMVPVASAAVTQEEWDQIFNKPWDHRGRWYCDVCGEDFIIEKKGKMASHCSHTFVSWRGHLPERTRIASKPRKSSEAPGLPPDDRNARLDRLGTELYKLWGGAGECPCCLTTWPPTQL